MKNLITVLLVGFAFAMTSFAAPPSKSPAILDTDIGADIDDAFALALIIHGPESDTQGFTRVVEGKPANATVGMHTDPKRFFEFYLRRVTR
jgi:hypothetical protein